MPLSASFRACSIIAWGGRETSGAAYVGDDAVGAEVVAAAHRADEGLRLDVVGVGVVGDFEVVEFVSGGNGIGVGNGAANFFR